jgi:hypothetical protein
MTLHQSQGYRLRFNLHVVTIAGCSVSEEGRRWKTILRRPFSEYRGTYREMLRRRRLDQPPVTDLARFMTAKT